MFLEVENLNKSYKNHKNKLLIEELSIFKNLNFSINNENIVTIYGPSGVGKTTFLNILGTIVNPDSGTISLKGVPYSEKSYHSLRKKNIGYVFQFHYLLPEFNVFENLKLVLDVKRIYSKKIENTIFEYLERFGIRDKVSNYPSQLSGGEKQKVSVIRAIISKPDLVLADEPTGNLDADNSESLVNQIKNISDDFNIKFIIATHDRSFQKISDAIYKIDNYQFLKNK